MSGLVVDERCFWYGASCCCETGLDFFGVGGGNLKLITSVAPIALLLLAVVKSDSADQTCSISDPNEVDPALKSFSFDVGDGKKTTMVYVEPDVTTFYEGSELPASTKVVPKFNGFAGELIFDSPKPPSDA